MITIGNKLSNYVLEFKALLAVSLLFLLSFGSYASDHTATHEASADHKTENHETSFDALGHTQDCYFWEFTHSDGKMIGLHLPVILFVKGSGLEIFSSSKFFTEGKEVHEHGHSYFEYKGWKMDGHGHHIEALSEDLEFYDFSISKNVVAMFLSVFVMLLVFFAVKKGYKKNDGKAPKGIQSFFEPIIIFVRDEIAKANIGEKHHAKFMPYLLTIFFFIWFNNLLGLLPAAANVTGNIAVTGSLAVMTLIITVINGKKTYWSHIFNPLGNSMPFIAKIPLYIILIPIEVVGIFTKPFSLTIRLLANITAGHVIILSILGLTFAAQNYFVGGVASLFSVAMYMMELFVALLQAYIFTLLSAMYFGSAVEEGHH